MPRRLPTPTPQHRGLLFIGDQHLCHRVPGFRKDDYPRAILEKLRWCLEYARSESLQPILLGDLFHYPRDNANWLIVALIDLLDAGVLAIHGNHDCYSQNELTEDDSLTIVYRAGRVQLLDRCGPRRLDIGGRCVIVGGTPWGRSIPRRFDPASVDGNADANGNRRPLVFWVTHHDVGFVGYEETARFAPFEISGVDVVVNGHIHRPLPDVVAGATTWINPGAITRITRSDATRERVPAALRIDVHAGGWSRQVVQVPHQSFDDVFHPELARESIQIDESLFVRALAELVERRTQTGAGLHEFLRANLDQFDPRVQQEVRALAQEVCGEEAAVRE